MRRRNIVQGEHAVVSDAGVVIQTVLGSCIAVCLFDPLRKVGGMNHFLLGEPTGKTISVDEQRCYGIYAMEVLVNAMMHHGSNRSDMLAHLFGGATMIAGLGDIGARNIAFAREFLRVEGIAVRHEDVGGRQARRVEFLAHEGKTRCRVAHEPVPAPVPVKLAVRASELELF